jgi:hypothetical protein
MWLWFGALPLSWLFGVPFGGALVLFASPSLPLVVAMLVVLAGTGLAARYALNY